MGTHCFSCAGELCDKRIFFDFATTKVAAHVDEGTERAGSKCFDTLKCCSRRIDIGLEDEGVGWLGVHELMRKRQDMVVVR